MQIENYFYFNGVPYEQLSNSKQKEIDQLIDRIKSDHLYERMCLYQDHFFNIVQHSNHNKLQRRFESDLPDDLTKDIMQAYLTAAGLTPSVN